MAAPSPRRISEAFTDLAQTARKLLEAEPTMPEEDQRLWQDMLEAESAGDPFEVLDQLVHAAAISEAYAEGVGNHILKLGERRERHRQHATRLRRAVKTMLERLELTNLLRPTYTASVSAGRVHVIPTKDAAEMPPRFQRVTVEVDKVALTEALKAGEKGVPAEYSNAEPHLTIRMR